MAKKQQHLSYRSWHGTSGTSAKKRAKLNETPHTVLADDVLAAIKLVGHVWYCATNNPILFLPGMYRCND